MSSDDVSYLTSMIGDFTLPSGKRISINAGPFAPIDIMQPQEPKNQLSISSSSVFEKPGLDILVRHDGSKKVDSINISNKDIKTGKILGSLLEDKKIDPNSIESLVIRSDRTFSYEGFPYLPNLKSLDVQCKVDSFNGLPSLPAVTQLNFNQAGNIKSFEGFPDLSNLKSLTINGTSMTKSFEGFPDLPNLESLTINGSSLESLEGFPDLPKLRKLSLDYLKIWKSDDYINDKSTKNAIIDNDLIEFSKRLQNCEIRVLDSSYHRYLFKNGQKLYRTIEGVES